jgi:branched-chain amino acid transport system substrate-binding protein
MVRTRRRLGLNLAAVLAVLALAPLSCSYQRGGSRDATVHSAAVLTGAPVVVGFVTQEDSLTGSFPETRRAAQAAAAYINQELGGVAGGPFQLKTCQTDGSPEGSLACAHQLIAAKPVAVISGVDLAAGAALPMYAEAKVPYVTASPQLGPELNDANSYALTGGTAAELMGALQYLIPMRHDHRINILYVDLPGLLTGAIAAAKTIFDKTHVASRLIAEKADAADFTPALTAATSDQPDAVVVVFPAASCQRILNTAAGIGTAVPIVVPGACATPSVLSGAGPTAHVLAVTSLTLVPDSGGTPDEQAYRTRVASVDQAPLAQAAFAAVLVTHRLLVESGQSPPTSTEVTRALAGSHDHPGVMTHAFTCNRAQLRILPSVCNAFVRILSWRTDRLTDLLGDWVDGRPIAKLIGP